jgi:hypothetical protein
MKNKKYFTLEEANDLLPLIEQEVTYLQNLKLKFDQNYGRLQLLKKGNEKIITKESGEDPCFALEAELDFIQIEAQNHISNIHNRGALLKDIDLGLIDFPAIKDGEEVELCWKLGEKSIAYYHGVTEGFMGRKPIE